MRNISSVLLSAICLIASISPASADNFEAFYSKFKSAVIKQDKEAVANMTKLPFDYDSGKLDRAKFIAKFPQIFPSSVRGSFAREKPIKDKSIYEVFSGESIYIFDLVNGHYMFTEIGVND